MTRKSSRIDELVGAGFCQRLRLLRKSLGLSGDDIAKKLGISSKSWWRYEYGEAEPGLTFLVRLVKIFMVSPLWLLTGEGEMFIEDKVVSLEDAPLAAMTAYLNETWKRANAKERIWLEVQFSKCFPDFFEWKRMLSEEEATKVTETNEK